MDSEAMVNVPSSSKKVEIIDLNRQLLKAAVTGDIEPFKQIEERPIENIVTPIKNTILHIHIASKGVPSAKFVEEILGICPSLLFQVNDSGDTPLHMAAKLEHVVAVEVLIKQAKAQHHQDLESGTGAVTQMLKMKNDKGNTALHEAMRKQSIEVVKILIEEDPDFPYSANHCGETPVYIAVEYGFLEAAEKMLGTCTFVSYDGPNGKTALHAAARRNNADLASLLLEKNQSLTKKIDDNGWTALHFATYYGHLEVAQKLLEFDKSTAYIADKHQKMLPLHLAICQSHYDIMLEILKYCPDCNERVDERGWNVLHFAMATLRKVDLLKLLKNPLIKMLVHEKDAKGNTPLHVLAVCAKSMISLDPLADILRLDIGDFSITNKKNVDAKYVFENGYPELEQKILALSKHTDDDHNRPYPMGLLRLQTKIHDEYMEFVRETRESHMIVATLIATVSFAAGFTLPGGLIQEGKNEGTPILSRNLAFQTFIIADTIALVLSLFAVYVFFVVSINQFKKFVYLTDLGCWATVFSMGAMLLAFVTGTYAMISPVSGLAIFICLVGFSALLITFPLGYILIKHFVKSKSPLMDLQDYVIRRIWGRIKNFAKLLPERKHV